jgi:hypothetical protein
LLAQARLDRNASALAEPDGAFVRVFFRQQPTLRKHFGRFLARDEPIEPVKFRNTRTIDRTVRIQDIDDRQAMPLANFEVHFVVRRSHFQNTRAESRIDRCIADDRQLCAIERAPDFLA